MATLEQLEEGIRRAHEAGNAEHVKALGQAYRQMQAQQTAGGPPEGSRPGMPEYAAWAAEQARAGEQLPQVSADPNAPDMQYRSALERVRRTQFPGMSDAQWAEYSPKALAPYGLKDLGQQSQTFGFGDEINAGIAALGSGARQLVGGGGPGFGGAYDATYELEQARLNYGREREGGAGLAMEVLGGASTMGPARTAMGTLPALAVGPTLPGVAQGGSRLAQTAKAAVPLAAEGGLYGFGSTDGDFGERLIGARNGAGLALAGGAAAPVVAKAVQGVGRRVAQIPVNFANRQAMQQAARTAPTAAGIKATSQAAYKATESTGAVIAPQAIQILTHDIQQLARLNGLVLPSGKLSMAFPKVANAIRTLREYTMGPVTMEQAQTLLKTLRTAQKSADPDEARVGNMMVNAFEDFMDGLPPAAFSRNGQMGDEAVQQWAKGRTEWARSKRTEAIENIISDARLAKGGFASGLRSGFASMLKSSNAKKRRGFSPSDLAAIERFVEGGPIDDLLQRLGSGAGLPGGIMGGVAGGVVGAMAVPAVGVGARRLTNRNARAAAEQLRAQVATPGGVPMRALPPPVPLPMPGLRMLGGQATNRITGR